MMQDASMCGVGIEEFWRLTPQELRNALAGYTARRNQDMEIAAWHLSYLINMQVKTSQRVTPAKLLGKSEGLLGLEMFGSVAEYQDYLNARLEGIDDDG